MADQYLLTVDEHEALLAAVRYREGDLGNLDAYEIKQLNKAWRKIDKGQRKRKAEIKARAHARAHARAQEATDRFNERQAERDKQ